MKVYKFPYPSVFQYDIQDWHTPSQKALIPAYRIVFFVVFVFVVVAWVILPLFEFIRRMFFKVKLTFGDSDDVPYSDLKSAMAYVPLLSVGTEKFLCSYMERIQPHHRPILMRSTPEDKDDLSSYVPIEYQQKVLSIVKYYGDDDDGEGDEEAFHFRSLPMKQEPERHTASSSQIPSRSTSPLKLNLADIYSNSSDSPPRLNHSKEEGKRSSFLNPSAMNTVAPDSIHRPNRKVQKKVVMEINNPTTDLPLGNESKHFDAAPMPVLPVENGKYSSNRKAYRFVLKPTNKIEHLDL